MTESRFEIKPAYQPLARQVGLDAETVFDHPAIQVWRSIAERQNATLDAQLDGRPIRLHIKRHHAGGSFPTPAEEEVRGIELLEEAGIRTTPLVAWGSLPDGRSFVITEDLAGFADAEKLVRGGVPFEKVLVPTAELAAKLHEAGLHHRDLYLCHFFARIDGDRVELALIDAARVKHLPPWPLGQRWIVKDLAQFWYSAQEASATGEQLDRWLNHYAQRREVASCALGRLFRAVQAKARWIARHDQRLRSKQPLRNISLPP